MITLQQALQNAEELPQRIVLRSRSVAWIAVMVGVFCIPAVTSSAAESELTEVLVYYANETSPDAAEAANYETFTKWLESSDSQKAHKIAQSLKQDAEFFPKAVDAEVTAIRTHALNTRYPLPVLIFTNRLAREGKCLIFDPRRDDDFRELPVKRVASENLIVNSNPLSQGSMLWQALEIAAKTFDPQQFSFVLVTKSHGGPDLGLTVKLARRASEVSREQVLQHLKQGTSDVPTAVIGTSKDQYLEILRRAGDELGMSFPVVFMESCQGSLSATQAAQVPASVGILFSGGQRFLEYHTLDYSKLLASIGPKQCLSDVLSHFLKPRYLSISPPGRRWISGWRWIWFVPIAAWLVWIIQTRWNEHLLQQAVCAEPPTVAENIPQTKGQLDSGRDINRQLCKLLNGSFFDYHF